MTNAETINVKDREAQRRHEFNLKILELFAKDPDLKYYVGILGGLASGVALAEITKLIDPDTNKKIYWGYGPIAPDQLPYYRYPTAEETAAAAATGKKPETADLGTAPEWLATLLFPAISSFTFPDLAFKEVSKNLKAIGVPTGGTEDTGLVGGLQALSGVMGNIASMAPMGFGAFCMSYLLLKAICGNEGIGKVLGGIGGLGTVASVL